MKTYFNTNNLLAMALMSLAAATGCDEGDGAGFGEGDVSERCLSGCGPKFNTFLFGKLEAGELARNPQEIHDGVRLAQVRLVCPSKDSKYQPKPCLDNQPTFKLDNVWSAKGELTGTAEGKTYKGSSFYKSQWFVEFYDENKVMFDKNTLTVNKYEEQPGFHYYTFDYPNPINPKELSPACKETLDPLTGQYVGTKAVAIEDIVVDTNTGVIEERPNMIYMACVSGAVGKATTWGYRPYDPQVGTKFFTTSVRVVRADYCGDGDSWTTTGNALQLADAWGYSGFAGTPGPTEALWTEKGAACLGEPRWVTEYKYEDVTCNGAKLEPCKQGADLSTYGDTVFWSTLP